MGDVIGPVMFVTKPTNLSRIAESRPPVRLSRKVKPAV